MIKDCSTCEFHGFTPDGISMCLYHGDTTRKHREGKNCGDWDLSFQAWVALMEKD